MKKVELLAPAGDFDCLKAAINNGADAVYIGGTNFSARNFAKNFDLDEVEQAVKYAHLRNVKIYLAINTLLTDEELEQAMELVKKYYELNVDALIIQDLGLYYLIKKNYPDFELHASTQMHIHNLQGVKNAKSFGFSRAIVARETSLENLENFCKEDIEIECFVHGALCVSYSGQCLMSSFTKDRSANRGECSQCCRLKYYYKDQNKIYNSNTEYLLSPKDMMLLKDLPKLIEAGVSSFKIEGRLKSPAYVGFVTRIYRQAIDSYYSNKSFSLSNNDMNNLKVLFNRGFTNSYLHSNNNDVFGNIRPNNLGIEIGHVINSSNGFVQIKLNKELKIHDAIRILNDNEDYGTEVFEMYINNNKVEKGNPNDIVSLKINRLFNINDTVLKTSDLTLEKDILQHDIKKRDININMICKSNEKIHISCEIDNNLFEYTNEFCPEKPINYPIDKELLFKQFSKVNDHPYNINSFVVDINECYINIKQINEIRRDFYDKLDLFILQQFSRKKLKECTLINDSDYTISNNSSDINIVNNKYNDYILNPTVNINSKYNDDNNIVSEFGGLLLNGNKIANYTLNIYNSFAYELLLKLGFNKIILSSELKDEDVIKLINSFKSRNNKDIIPYVVKSGNINLMNIYDDPFDERFNEITDRKYSYKITRLEGYTTLSSPIDKFIAHKSNNLYRFVNIK